MSREAFVLCSYDMTADVDHLHVKIIYLEFLVGHLYIVREDYMCGRIWYFDSRITSPCMSISVFQRQKNNYKYEHTNIFQQLLYILVFC
jgi:hypothetical protein